MREFKVEKHMKLPVSLGDACERMYQSTWFDAEPIRMVWNNVEIVMRKQGGESD